MKIIAINRYAAHEYHILDKYTAGLVLSGAEVKVARSGTIGLKEAFGVVQGNELFLLNAHFPIYSHSKVKTMGQERRSRKLLLNRQEIDRILGDISRKGLTLIPLKLFFDNKGYLKVEIALAKHKKLVDRRNELKERDLMREALRDLKG